MHMREIILSTLVNDQNHVTHVWGSRVKEPKTKILTWPLTSCVTLDTLDPFSHLKNGDSGHEYSLPLVTLPQPLATIIAVISIGGRKIGLCLSLFHRLVIGTKVNHAFNSVAYFLARSE